MTEPMARDPSHVRLPSDQTPSHARRGGWQPRVSVACVGDALVTLKAKAGHGVLRHWLLALRLSRRDQWRGRVEWVFGGVHHVVSVERSTTHHRTHDSAGEAIDDRSTRRFLDETLLRQRAKDPVDLHSLNLQDPLQIFYGGLSSSSQLTHEPFLLAGQRQPLG